MWLPIEDTNHINRTYAEYVVVYFLTLVFFGLPGFNDVLALVPDATFLVVVAFWEAVDFFSVEAFFAFVVAFFVAVEADCLEPRLRYPPLVGLSFWASMSAWQASSVKVAGSVVLGMR